mgnify:CR=1 FL=1
MPTFPRSLRASALALVVLGLVAAPVAGQSAADIIDRMLTEYESRTEGIDNYTLVQDLMGFQATSYFVKEMVDGRPVFKLQNMNAAGMNMQDSGPGTIDEIYALGDDFKDNATYVGRETIDGRDNHVLEITDLENTELGQQMGQDSEFKPISGRLFLDVEEYMPRRMIFEGELTNAEGVHAVTSTMDMLDYREHEGMLVAHETVMTVEGLGAAIDEDARAQFEQMERELENMPAEQRRMVESMMADQLEQFRAMMAGEDEPMVIRVQVSDVRVNTGPPGGR